MNIFKRIAAHIVVIYARHLFRQAQRQADYLHAKNKRMYYVATKVFHAGHLSIYDKFKFKAEKSCFGYQAVRLTTLVTLMNGCYYHTPDTAGNQAMSQYEIDRRLDYFIKERLLLAGLLK